ncbi:MAG: MtrB/PioB family decaheme-associated outer membrane protein [Steroidobacteraceae bacterium]
MTNRSLLITIAVAACLHAAAARADEAAAPDTSGWTCSKCPFTKGYEADVELGGGYLDDSSAKFGDYTGLDEKGGYVVADAEGTYAGDDGYAMSYELTDLGLNSRAIRLEGGVQGTYDYALWYDRVPHTIWDTTRTPYRGIGSNDLTLPSGWVDAGSTAGMTTLDADLHDVDVGYDRDRYGVAGRYLWGQNLILTVDFRRDKRDGTRSQFGSFGSTSTQLLAPVNDSTDRVTAGLRYQESRWFVEIAYNGSFYRNDADAWRWQNPFTPMVAGADTGQMSGAPGNDYNELALSAGMYGLPGNTTVAFSAATGKGTQDQSFLPYTINPDVYTNPLPMGNLNGDVDVTRFDLTLASRPMDPLRLRGSLTYDERKDSSKQAAFDSVVYTDMLPVAGTEVNPLYGFERFRALGSADWVLMDDVTIGAGGEYREIKRTGTPQEVKRDTLLDGWGRVEYRPSGYLGLVLRAGAQETNPDKYNLDVAADNGQNPYMRLYNMAYRFRQYGELVANLALGSLPLTLSGTAYYADDGYDKSQVGLISGLYQRFALDLNWTVNDKVTAYVNGGFDTNDTEQWGASTFSFRDWKGSVDDTFTTIGAGVSAKLMDKLALDIGYTWAQGDSRTQIKGTNEGRFPKVTSDLNSLKADLTYEVSDKLDVLFTWWYENLDSKDWALQGIGPATLPNVLALGADPYNYSVNYVTLSARYSFGSAPAAAKDE